MILTVLTQDVGKPVYIAPEGYPDGANWLYVVVRTGEAFDTVWQVCEWADGKVTNKQIGFMKPTELYAMAEDGRLLQVDTSDQTGLIFVHTGGEGSMKMGVW